MAGVVRLPEDFSEYLKVDNAADRFAEAYNIARKLAAVGIPVFETLDHAAIFSDPPYLVAGPLKRLGYVSGWDERCYPSPVDGCDYINVSARLPEGSPARRRGWFNYVAVVHPVDEAAREMMLSHGYGNPFLHHVTWGIVPPPREGDDDYAYAARAVAFMVDMRLRAKALGDPGTLICALPAAVVEDPRFGDDYADWIGETPADQHQVETMQGGGFLIQFFVLAGGRIEVALRVDTKQTFNPTSVRKISRDEISTDQDD